MENWKKVVLAGAGLGGLALLAKAMKEAPTPPAPTPPTPPTPAPITNPSFEQGLTGWNVIRYAPHPTPVGNAPEHLVETTTTWKTHGRYSLHIRAGKVRTHNVVCSAYQDIDLSKAVEQGYNKLTIDTRAILDRDASREPWGDRPYYTFVEISLGQKRVRFLKQGIHSQRVTFNLAEIQFPARLKFQVQLWDNHQQNSFYELYADNIRISK